MIKNNKNAYDWQYVSVGGMVRVKISKGEDIAHLCELDRKLWTVLSCPVKGLELDPATLGLLDTDGDGMIKVDEIIAASQYLTMVVKDKETLLKGESELRLDDIDAGNETGEGLLKAAKLILKYLGVEKESISVSDLVAEKELFAAKKPGAGIKSKADAAVFPFGDDTEAADAAFRAVKDKVDDFFMRCRLVAYNEKCAEAVDMSLEKIGAIAGKNIALSGEEIEECPLAQPNKEVKLNLGAINPSWQARMQAFSSLALKQAKSLNQEEWDEIVSKLSSYEAWKAEQIAIAEADPAYKEEADAIASVDKLLHLYRDFYCVLKNFVIFEDFYSTSNGQRAIFEAGDLFIDQRCCKLCIKVNDMSKHTDMPKLSGMFLIYCKCFSKTVGATMDIVAVMTSGGIRNLREGKNAIFYDRQGNAWDAVVTKIVDNPINIRQAFYSPYRKFWAFCTGLLNKSAEEKEKNAEALLKADAQNLADKNAAKPQAFDIAKFAGIFAALGMGIGFIGTALAKLGGFIEQSPWYVTFVGIIGIMLLISGPSCFIAWTKLRKRDLGPVLNANGWAINSVVLVNTLFGATLTKTASYPRLNLSDPYKKKTPVWKKVLGIVILLALIVLAGLYFGSKYGNIMN